MTASEKCKNPLIEVSSSSSENNGDEVDLSSNTTSSFSSGSRESDDDYNVGDVYDGDEDEEEEEDDDDDDVESKDDVDDDDDKSLANLVTQFLQGRRNLQELSLKACKAYLRDHGLRVSGNKDECVHRIQEHWRIKGGKAEVLYPMSSFVINCTGDVCKGDIVLFKQKVYGSFDKVTRKGKLLGKRTIAGRVVKESYGAAKQQHTFTVEVLWSKGTRKLPSLVPLLVKGRNLYKLKTYRQLWKNEGERRKVLAEKHKRGTVARNMRAKRKKALPTNQGRKSRKIFPSERHYHLERSRKVCGEKGASSSTHMTINRHKQQHNVNQGPFRNTSEAKFIKHFFRPQNSISQNGRVSALQSFSQLYTKAAVGPYRRIVPSGSHTAKFHGEIPYLGPNLMPRAPNGASCYMPTGNYYGIKSPWMAHIDSRQFISSRSAPGQWTNGRITCSIRGCYESGSNECVISACRRCCHTVGRVCNVHR